MRTPALTLALGLALPLAACGGGADPAQINKLSSDLVSCKNDLDSLKDQLEQAKVALKKAEEAAGMVVKLDPIDIKSLAQSTTAHHMEGNVKPDEVVKVVKANSGGLKNCYEHALKRKPDLQYVSSVKANFTLRNNGSLASVEFNPHLDAQMEECMGHTMEKWHWPTFQGDPVSFEQPVNLVAK
jgi:hypothetical protein